MTMHRVMLTNSFHCSRVTILAPVGVGAGEAYADLQARRYTDANARRTLRRVQQALCGCEGCSCGGIC